MPELEVRVWPDRGNPEEIEYALVWQPLHDALSNLPNLKVIFSLGAGVDHLLKETGLPEGVPIVRMVDPGLSEGMREYVLFHVLRYHRHMLEYEIQQRECRWQELPQTRPGDRRIGIMGLGVLGAEVAQKLTALGFAVAGWSRTAKMIDGVDSFHGRDQLDQFLEHTDILVCLLPLTSETEGILNRRTFAALPGGAYVINVARGRHLIEEHLLEALDSEHIAGATLDVFRTEPLPRDHPFWRHPKVTVTPHIASITSPDTGAIPVVENIRRHQKGEPLTNVVDVK
ncbi:MAG: 2-hydroxyacid dehydrogenase, partial [Acidiferrobacterales bacterium]